MDGKCILETAIFDTICEHEVSGLGLSINMLGSNLS